MITSSMTPTNWHLSEDRFFDPDPAQRRVDYLPMRFEPTPFDFIAESPTSNYSFSFQRPLSGDDGIRTRGLRLAKALLSR